MEESVARVYRFKRVLKYSILALLITIIALFVFEYIRIKPNNVHFTNITSSSVTVSWDTKIKTDATAIYIEPENKLPFLILPITKERFFDTRDITKAELEATQQSIQNQEGLEVTMNDIVTNVSVSERGRYYTHHIEIKGLDPEKEYSFMVGDSLLFRKVKDINNKVIAKTYAVPESIVTPYPAYGAVRDAKGYDQVELKDLPIVNDGIVYVNYYDEISGEMSNVFSSPLNETGNWYMDLANAIDKEGNMFKGKYTGEASGLQVDITLNLGSLGIWTKQNNAAIISPAETFVINIPEIKNADNIFESSVKGTSIFNNLKKDAYSALILECSNDSDCLGDKKCAGGKCVPPECSKDLDCDDGERCYNAKCVTGTTCSGTKPHLFNGNCVQCVNDSNCSSDRKCDGSHNCVLKETDNPDDDPDDGKKECVFLGWCSCGMVEIPGNKNLNKPCSGEDLKYCEKKFQERLCDGYLPPQENGRCDSWNGGTKGFGEGEFRNGVCKVCGYRGSGSARYVGWNDADEKIWDMSTCKKKTVINTSASCGSKSKTVSSDNLILANLTGTFCGVDSELYENAKEYKYDGYTIWKWICKKIGYQDKKNCSGALYLKDSDNKPELKTCRGCSLKFKYKEQVWTAQDCDNLAERPSTNMENELNCACIDAPQSSEQDAKECSKEIIDCAGCSLRYNNVYETWKAPAGVSCNAAQLEANITKNLLKDCSCTSGTQNYSNYSEQCEYNVGQYCWTKGVREVFYCNDEINKCYSCVNGKWEEESSAGTKSCENFLNNIPYSCDSSSYHCFDRKNNIVYKCVGKKWKKMDSDDTIATNLKIIYAGQVCDEIRCFCNSGPDQGQQIGIDKHCRQVNSDCNKHGNSGVGKICRRDGAICSKYPTANAYYCAKPLSSSLINVNNKILSFNFDASVFGKQEINNSQTYIIDQTTGLISGLEEGIYSFENNGDTYFFDISEESLKANNGNVLIFIDKNENGEYDEGVDTKISTLGAQIQITTIQKSYKYSLKEGFNFVSFPFVVAYEDYRTAAGLLTQLNSVYGDVIYSISKYDGSWKVVGQNAEVYDNNDFQLLPGQGYIIKSKENVEITIPGKPVKYESETDSAPISLYKGWNLIGLYGTGVKSYTAKTMIQDINNYTKVDFTADNVSKWDTDVQRYEGYQLTNENGLDFEYGFDYPIDILKSYFLRVNEGTGNWQPELAK